MSIKKRIEVKHRQKEKRRKNRLKIQKKGSSLNDYYYGRFYIGPSNK